MGKTSSCKIYHHATYLVDIPRSAPGSSRKLVAGAVGEETDEGHEGDRESCVRLMGDPVMNTVLITGSSGLVGSAASEYFLERKWKVVGVDNDSRADFFGRSGSTYNNQPINRNYKHCYIDIRDAEKMNHLWTWCQPDAVVHCAAQPAHEYSKIHPLEDFEINAYATVKLLELCRNYIPEAPFVFLSSSKVYGLNVDGHDYNTIDETIPIDQAWHSPYGASKAAADMMVQEYGYEYGMKTVCLRPNCMTGVAHAGVESHGFLNYLVKCAVNGDKYKVFGFGGQQVRDNIHSVDVASAIWECVMDPEPAGVYNIGGGPSNATSIIDLIDRMHVRFGFPMTVEILEQERGADHFIYVTDNSKFQARYPGWKITQSLDQMIQEIVDGQSTSKISEAVYGYGSTVETTTKL